ncbi:LysR family transcriptional regulator [Novosphingobium nitrogenifigens DSM 19370]|uniref:LysR family transcriptional regulator n=1 Tax=Novosphingobium nitrogenifigens DSM 19370 TaxID=983920 RepID=F1Z9U7_9SPHN|nr:LysR family transcriptional regulator [Novosphingobium nitrogenifigens]EGD58645.1 LysR family transcriptional regulator [Novosphingobium nitrogenifigens DSM 19370]
MELHDAGLLIEIARRGSFARVARDRGADPSWVSRKVADIEDELGFRIFHRTTRRVSLTEAGTIYLREAETIVEALDRARDNALSVSQVPSGTLRITCTVAFGQKILVPLLPRFRRDYPQVDLELVLSDASLDLVEDRIDLAIRLGPGVSGDFVVSKLRDTRYRVCASPDYLRRQGRPATPAALAGHDCLRFLLPGFRNRWLFRDGAGAVEPVEIKGSVVSTGALALHAMALAGMGPVLLASWLVDDDIASGALVDLFPDRQATATTFETAIWMLYPSRSFLPQKVRAMIDFLRAEAETKWRAW